MSKFAKRLGKTVLITALLLYTCFVLISQEATFYQYEEEMKHYDRLLEEEMLKKEQLQYTKTQISSKEYIEQIAREKLGYVMPNELVFVDANL